MRAITTDYNGLRFRSRLEARWAVFFDTVGIKYRYEPEGYEFSDGSRYLPDFYLPDIRVWVEVKGAGLASALGGLITASKELNAGANTRIHKYHEGRILLLGDVPDGRMGTPAFPLLTYQNYFAYAYFGVGGRFDDDTPDYEGWGLFTYDDEYIPPSRLSGLDSPPCLMLGTNVHFYKEAERLTLAGLRRARTARFEFGETPKGTKR